MEREKLESIIESLLFVAGEPLSMRRVCDIVDGAAKSEVQGALDELLRKWDDPSRGMRVVEVAGGFQLQTIEDNAPWVGKLLQSRPVRLSRASLESLAIVAYKQPVTKAEIEEVRGVDSGGVLKTLLDHGFIKIAGRKDVPGKPLIYATDKRFMEFFRLKSLAELPTLRELSDIQEERISEASDQGILPLGEDQASEAMGEDIGPDETEEAAAGGDEVADDSGDPGDVGPDDDGPDDVDPGGEEPEEDDPDADGPEEGDTGENEARLDEAGEEGLPEED